MDVSARLKPSPWLLGATIVALGAGLVGVWLTNLTISLSLAIGFSAVVASLYHCLWLLGRLPNSIRVIHFKDEQWSVELANGQTEVVHLVGSRVVLPFLISISLRSSVGVIPCLIFADAVSVAQHRRLRSAVVLSPMTPSYSEQWLLRWRERSLVLAKSWWHQNGICWFRRLQGIVERIM